MITNFKAPFSNLLAFIVSLSLLTRLGATNEQSCYLSNAWCTNPTELSSPSNFSSKWGSYRPGSYFGLKSKTMGTSIGTGIMWSSSISQGKGLRDETSQDKLSRFEWLRHDGSNFGTEVLVDNNYDLHINASFVIPDQPRSALDSAVGKVPAWFQKIEIAKGSTEVSANVAGESKSFIFYFGVECGTTTDATECREQEKVVGWKINNHKGSAERGFDQAVSVVGYSKTMGWFCMFLIAQQKPKSTGDKDPSPSRPPVLSFAGLADATLLSGSDRVKKDAKQLAFDQANPTQSGPGSKRSKRHQQQQQLIFDEFGELTNTAEDGTSFVAIHAAFTEDMRVDVLLYTDLTVNSETELSGFIDHAERKGHLNVLPFFLSTAVHLSTDLTVAHRSLTTLSAPTGTSTAAVDIDGATATTPKLPTTESSNAVTKREEGAASAAQEEKDSTTNGKAVATMECGNRGECIRKEIDELLTMYSENFDERFESVFAFDAAAVATAMDNAADSTSESITMGFTENDMEIAKVCLSSVLGGMGYFQGRPSIGVGADVEHESESHSLSEVNNLKQLIKRVNHHSSLVSLFTATPSRTSFPRGFLWDEGFHEMLISTWNPALSLEVLGSWLQAMHFPCTDSGDGVTMDKDCVGGWIPREMILGEEARRRVPDEFIVQRVNIANPPTFLLVVESLLKRFSGPNPPPSYVPQRKPQLALPRASSKEMATSTEEVQPDPTPEDTASEALTKKRTLNQDYAALVALEYQVDREMVLSYVRDIYPLLHKWVQWFLHTQRGSDAYPGSFRWRGRSKGDGKVIPNTLASGLDDYPRAPLLSPDEHHVDLHSWMAKATGIMAFIESTLADSEFPLSPSSVLLSLKAEYKNHHEYLLQRLEELHWSAEHKGFFDVGLNNEESYFTQEVVFRCSSPTDQSNTIDVQVPVEVLQQRRTDFCPASHPKPLYPLGDGRGKYQMVERMVVENPTLSHIPRVGYVSIFPLLLRLLDPYSPKLGAVLDMVEDPQQLWTEHGLRSISLSDKFYQRRNSEGDAPYWR